MIANSLFGPTDNLPDRTVTITRPDDWHVHLRDGEMLEAVLPYTAAQFARAIVMPNLSPPVVAIDAARSYRDRIIAARPAGSDFEPLMTCYLTDDTRPEDIETGYRQGVWTACKLYPAGATTNSSHGVTDISGIAPVLERMERIGMPLLLHGEVTDPEVDVFDREAVFIDTNLAPLLKRHPALKMVLEHITTTEGIAVVREHAGRLAATITPHHLILNRSSLFKGGLRPHYYCLPVAKREHHRLALRKAATSGEACFFLGTDSAPHQRSAKESECCSAGIFSGATALQTYAQVFDEENALDKLEAFASLNGPRFYGLPVNTGTITLRRSASSEQPVVTVGQDEIVNFRGGEILSWSLGETTTDVATTSSGVNP